MMIRRQTILLIALLIVGCDNSTEPEVIVIPAATEICDNQYSDADGSIVSCDENCELYSGACYHSNDLNVLRDIKAENDSLADVLFWDMGWDTWNDGRLEKLTLLNQYQFTTLPESIGNLSSLEWLSLQSNQLTNLPESIGDLSSLETLNIRHNQLTTIPESIGNLSNLTNLNLAYSQLTSLPQSIWNLSRLEELYLQNNQLTYISDSIGNLSSLERLELGSNQLISLPESIGDLSSLERLGMQSNQLTSLPESIGNLSNIINSFNVSDNQLTSLPESIGNIGSENGWWYLRINNNQLTSLPESICNLLSNCTIIASNNQLCEDFHYDCIDDNYWEPQDTSNCP